MKDVLRELQSLSLKLQRRGTTLVDSHRYIQQTIEILNAMKMHGGKSTAKAQQSILAGLFKGVSVTGERIGRINSPQLYQAVVDNLTARLPSDDLVQVTEAP